MFLNCIKSYTNFFATLPNFFSKWQTVLGLLIDKRFLQNLEKFRFSEFDFLYMPKNLFFEEKYKR